MSTPIFLLPGTLPYTCIPSDAQQLNVDIVTRIQGFLNENFPGIYVGPTASPPSASMRDRIWINTDTPWWYQWVAGEWRRKYQFVASSNVEIIWKGNAANLATFDGGDAGAVGLYSGPLWEIDHELDGRTLVGPGTVPAASPAITVPEPTDATPTGGEAQVILTPEHLQHIHGTGTDGGIDDPPTMLSRAWSSVKNFVRRINDLNTTSSSGWHDDATALASGTMGTTEPYADPNYPTSTGHPNMQPWIARYVIKRTGREWVNAPY